LDIEAAQAGVWVLINGHILKINPSTNRVVESVRLAIDTSANLAASNGMLFASQEVTTPAKGAIFSLDAKSGKEVGDPLEVPSPSALLFASGRVWSVNQDGQLTTFDPSTARVNSMSVSPRPDVSVDSWLAYGSGTLWLGISYGNTNKVLRFTPTT
jgi:streptogramin lyase